MNMVVAKIAKLNGAQRFMLFIAVALLAAGAEARHYSFVRGYPAEVSEARAKAMEQNGGVKADIKVSKVTTTVRRNIKMSTKCRHCGSTSYGSGCIHSSTKKHEHRDDEKHCEWCGSSSYGSGCIHSPTRKHRHGPGANKCIWCGSSSNGSGCIHSPTGKHEK